MVEQASRQLYQGQYFSLEIDTEGVEFVRCDDEVLIVPLLQNGSAILVYEPSVAFKKNVLILPGGSVQEDEGKIEAANRELQEEIGFRANSLCPLGMLTAFSKYLTVRSFVYLARDLVPSRLRGDEDYVISPLRVPLESFETLLESGELLDARAIAALYMTRRYLISDVEGS